MLRNGRAGYRKCAGDLAGGLRSAAQKVEHCAAGGIGEGMEGGFLIPGR
jgi:hypothetical protein